MLGRDAVEGGRPHPALHAGASLEHRAVADDRRASWRRDRRSAADPRPSHRSRRDGADDHAGAQAGRARACLERARLGARRQARHRDRAFGWCEDPARRVSIGAADHGRRSGDRVRFLRVLRAQAVRADGDRRALGQAGTARCDASVPGWRVDDRQGVVREDHLRAAAGTVRGGDAAYRRCARAACGDRLCREHRAPRDPCARDRAGDGDA